MLKIRLFTPLLRRLAEAKNPVMIAKTGYGETGIVHMLICVVMAAV